MADGLGERPIHVPKGLIIGAGLLMLAGILLAGVARRTGTGHQETVASTPVASRDLLFRSLPDDVIEIADGASHQVIVSYPAGKGGMVRGALRGFAYQRKVRGATLESAPFRLTEWKNGLLTLDDSVTSDRIELDTFGPDNRQAWAALLTAHGDSLH